jgi:hypothetical protein
MNPVPETESIRDRKFTRRAFMTYRVVLRGTHALAAMEAVSSWAIDNPDVDMDEEMTWSEWMARGKDEVIG